MGDRNIFHSFADWWGENGVLLLLAILMFAAIWFTGWVTYSGGYEDGRKVTERKYQKMVEDGDADVLVSHFKARIEAKKAEAEAKKRLEELEVESE